MEDFYIYQSLFFPLQAFPVSSGTTLPQAPWPLFLHGPLRSHERSLSEAETFPFVPDSVLHREFLPSPVFLFFRPPQGKNSQNCSGSSLFQKLLPLHVLRKDPLSYLCTPDSFFHRNWYKGSHL